MATGAILFAFLAGVVSTLSPCVLPLLPLVLGAAVSEHRFGPAALAAGLAAAFVAIGGCFVAAASWLLRRQALVPLRDPRLAESLAFENA